MWRAILVFSVLIAISCASACSAAAPVVVDAYYRVDVPFPEFTEYWKDTSDREAALGLRLWEKPLAGSTHIYLQNNGSTPLEIQDVQLVGISLKRAMAFSDQDVRREADPASIYFSDLSAVQRGSLIAAGDPIWWRIQPQVVQPGEICEVAVRFRYNPPGKSAKLVLDIKGGKPMSIDVPLAARPRIESISFSSKLDTVYAYCTTKTGRPAKVLVNGSDVTASSKIAYDAAVGIAPIIISLPAPLKRGSYCCVEVCYPKGARVTELVKVWSDEPTYGMWGGMPGEEGDVAGAKAYYDDLALHNINCQVEQIGSGMVLKFLASQEGRDYLKSLGIRRTINEFGKQGWTDPYLYFLADEPESADFYVTGVPPTNLMGCMTQGMVQKAQDLHKNDPVTPCALNMNRTFPPNCFYAYGQVGDILMTDPYYQALLSSVINGRQTRLPLYYRAHCIYAMSKVPCSACAPRPLQMVLYAVSGHNKKGETKFRFPTGEEKRVEMYYCLGAGAKQISYWWYAPVAVGQPGANGCGDSSPEARALWREIGLLGAEFRTVDSLIADGCSADLAVSTPNNLWIRSLLCGDDTAIILCVNENYACDRMGTTYTGIPETQVSVTLPGWLKAADAFEVTYKGTNDVKWKTTAQKLDLNLGETTLTRMIVVTANKQLRSSLQSRYTERFAANVAKLISQAQSTTQSGEKRDTNEPY